MLTGSGQFVVVAVRVAASSWRHFLCVCMLLVGFVCLFAFFVSIFFEPFAMARVLVRLLCVHANDLSADNGNKQNCWPCSRVLVRMIVSLWELCVSCQTKNLHINYPWQQSFALVKLARNKKEAHIHNFSLFLRSYLQVRWNKFDLGNEQTIATTRPNYTHHSTKGTLKDTSTVHLTSLNHLIPF